MNIVSRAAAAVAAALVAAGALVGLTAAPASAHAQLLATDPGDRSRVETAPEQITLEFNEDVTAGLGSVRAFAAGGERVDDGDVVDDGTRVTVGLRDDLDDGAYVVTWRAVSADAHPIRGAFTFTVGDGEEASDSTVAALLGEGDDRGWEVAGAVGRTAAYAGTLLAAGGAVFLVLAHDGGPERRRLRRIVSVAGGVGVVGVLAAVPVQAALASGLGIGAVVEGGVVRQVLGDGVGPATLASLVGLAAVIVGVGALDRQAVGAGGADDGAGAVAPAPPTGRRWAAPVALAGAFAATVAFALAGHNRTATPTALATVADAVHVAAAAAWAGGLVLLAVVLRRRTAAGDATGAAGVVARFSTVATVSVLAVAVAGTALGWGEVRTLDALTSTTYGWLLVAKVAVVAVVAGLGAWNHFRLVPSLDRAPKRATSRLRRTVAVEGGVLAVVVVLTAVLVNVTPARTEAGVGSIFSTTVALAPASGDPVGEVNLVVDPNQAGRNSIHLYIFDEAGRPVEALEAITVRLTLDARDIGPLEREPFVAGPGHWQVDGGDLSIAGRWTIDVVARTDRFTEATMSADVDVQS